MDLHNYDTHNSKKKVQCVQKFCTDMKSVGSIYCWCFMHNKALGAGHPQNKCP